MKSITCTARVTSDHKATIDMPDELQPGMYTVRVFVEELQHPHSPEETFEGLPTVRAWAQLKDQSLRREDLYGDEGR